VSSCLCLLNAFTNTTQQDTPDTDPNIIQPEPKHGGHVALKNKPGSSAAATATAAATISKRPSAGNLRARRSAANLRSNASPAPALPPLPTPMQQQQQQQHNEQHRMQSEFLLQLLLILVDFWLFSARLLLSATTATTRSDVWTRRSIHSIVTPALMKSCCICRVFVLSDGLRYSIEVSSIVLYYCFPCILNNALFYFFLITCTFGDAIRYHLFFRKR